MLPKILAAGVVGLLLGYGVAQLDQPTEESKLDGPTSSEQRLLDLQTQLETRLTRAEEERDSLKKQLARIPAHIGRDPSPTLTFSPTNVSHSGELPALPPKASVSGPTPERAQQLLAEMKDALAAGDEDALASIMKAVVEHGALLVPDLLELLDTSDSLFEQQNLARILGEIGDKKALSKLQELLKDAEDDAVRTATVKALGQLADPTSVGLLANEFKRKSSSPMPASLAATSLGQIGNQAAVGSLQSQIEEGDNPMVRSFALRALSNLKSADLSTFFYEQASRKGVSERYRISAIKAMGTSGNKKSVWQLEKIAFSKEVSQGEQEAAKRAINRLSGRKVY